MSVDSLLGWKIKNIFFLRYLGWLEIGDNEITNIKIFRKNWNRLPIYKFENDMVAR
jgi:hypothetical protein